MIHEVPKYVKKKLTYKYDEFKAGLECHTFNFIFGKGDRGS